MRLWAQSFANFGVNPKFKDYEESLTKHVRGVAREGTQVDVYGTVMYNNTVNTHQYGAFLHTAQMIEAAIKAEREGYDAFVQIGTLDVGFYEIREAVEIPVIFPTETNLHVATMLAPKFGFLSMNEPFLERANNRARAYGFQDHLTPGGCVDVSYEDMAASFKSPGPILKAVNEAAKKIGEQGADIIIIGGNVLTMILVSQGLTEIGGVPFLDSQGILIKVAEMMVDLNKMGINRKKMGLFSPMSRQELKNLRKEYRIES